jgi:NAD+ synthase (glutamine-hydrolysing)
MTDRTVPFRIAQASLNQTAFDIPRNMRNIFDAIDRAVEQGADLLALEEMTLTGYDAGDDFQKTDNDEIAALLLQIARYAAARDPNLIVSVGHPYYVAQKSDAVGPWVRRDELFNRINLPFDVQSFVGQGRVLGMTAKSYLFNYERGYEKRYFAEWPDDRTIAIAVPGQAEPVPFGRPVIRLADESHAINLAHVICEEKWVASRYDDPSGTDAFYEAQGVAPALARAYGREGLLLVIPNASPPTPMKADKHAHLARLASRYADAVVDTDGLGSSGSCFAQFGFRLVAQDEALVSEGARLRFARVASDFMDVTLAPAAPMPQQASIVAHRFAAKAPLAELAKPASWDERTNPAREVEELLRMNALWLFDVFRKTKTQGFVEAVSGGADSAYNSVLVYLMVRLAIRELGVEGFCREAAHVAYVDAIRAAGRAGGEEAAVRATMKGMLTCIYMGTENNPEDSRIAAEAIVREIGGVYMDREVQGLLNLYALIYANGHYGDAAYADLSAYVNAAPGASVQAIAAEEKRLRALYPHLTGPIMSAANPAFRLAYENSQARPRQDLVNLVANVENKISLANPNRTEAENGYTTWGGDMHGGTVAPNVFVAKCHELEVMRHVQAKGIEGVPPLVALKLALDKPPSAELFKLGKDGKVEQTDEGSLQRNFVQMERLATLMLDQRAGAVRQRRLHPAEVFEACQTDAAFQGLDEGTLFNMVAMTYDRWHLSQFKIHGSAYGPTFGQNRDHQVSQRTPNFSGADKYGLAQLAIRLLFARARAEIGVGWDTIEEARWIERTTNDEVFVDAVQTELRRTGTAARRFDLDGLYQRVKKDGMRAVFG